MRFVNAIAVCVILLGALILVGHLAGQLREGYATKESLLIGAVCLAFGILLSTIANVGMRLDRVEDRLKRSSDERRDSDLD